MVSYQPLSEDFGFIVRRDNAESLFSLDRDELIARFRSVVGGVILFRGFDVDERLFRNFTEEHGTKFVVHHRLAQRDYVDNDHTLATVNRGQYAINFHFEMASNPASADLFWMCCIRPSESGGRTGLVDGIKVLKKLTRHTKRLFEEHGHRYLRERVPPDLWRNIIPWVNSRADIEQWLSSTGASVGITRYEFDNEDRLTFEFYRCPIREGKFCQRPVFISGMLDDPSTPLGNMAMPKTVRDEVSHAVYQSAIWIDWRAGDVALIDNTRVMHAREAFEGTQRHILVRYSALRE
jgi:alpha-ketoglutarate-dependent taurine dioxygenase